MSMALPQVVRGLLALLLLTPLVISPGVFSHFSVSKAIYARVLIEILFVGWVFLAVKYPEFRPPRSRVLLALALYVLASLLAAVWGVNSTRSFWSTFDRMTGVVDLLHWALFALILASVLRSPKTWATFLNGQLAVALVLALIALTQAYGYSFIPSVVAKCRVDATLGNPSFLATVLVVAILVAAGLLARSLVSPGHHSEDSVSSGTRALRAFWLAVIAFGLLALVMTGTRGALIGLVAGALVMPVGLFIWGNRQALKPVTLAAAGLLSVLAILFAIDQSIGLGNPDCAGKTTGDRLTLLANAGTTDGSLATRLASVEAGWRGFQDRPVLGWGPENFGYAFDRHVDAWVFRHGSIVQDKAHNQVVEELTTKGAVGALAFLFLWLTLVWAIVGRKRLAAEDVLAYAVLGALGGYFVQNLFLFDTPSSLLVWLVLVGWAAAQERRPSSSVAVEDRCRREVSGGLVLPWMQRKLSALFAKRWSEGVAAILLLSLLGFSIYSFSLQPYLAARAFGQASQLGTPMAERIALSQQSFETFPAMANQSRQLMFLQLIRVWGFLDADDRQQTREFFGQEVRLALQTDPQNAPLLITAILFIQSTSQDPAVLAGLGPLLQQLQSIAPNRAETHQLLANQALQQGQYQEALRISQDYQATAPGTEWFFAGIERAAQQGLGRAHD